MFIDKINIKALKRQNNFDFYRKHVVQHIKILVYTCILYYLCIVSLILTMCCRRTAAKDIETTVSIIQ